MIKMRWTVHAPGWRPFDMVGPDCDRAEALAFARAIWPGAEVE